MEGAGIGWRGAAFTRPDADQGMRLRRLLGWEDEKSWVFFGLQYRLRPAGNSASKQKSVTAGPETPGFEPETSPVMSEGVLVGEAGFRYPCLNK